MTHIARIAIAVIGLSSLTIPAVVQREAAAADTMYNLEVDTADGNVYVSDLNLTIEDCADEAIAARHYRPLQTGSSPVVDIDCVPVRGKQ